MEKVTTHQAKTQLSQLIKRAQAGEDIVVYRGEVPMVRLVPVDPIEKPPGRPRVGTITSAPIKLSADAFSPLTDEELSEWGL